MPPEQILIVRMPDSLVRRMLRLLDSAGQGYENMNEFISTAVANQLNLTETDRPVLADRGLLGLPANVPDQFLQSPHTVDQGLFILTNRFAPVKVGLRVLLNMSIGGDLPTLIEFHRQASREARSVGLRLRGSDEAARRSSFARRWIGFPLGDDADASSHRYVNCFTINTDSANHPNGPMAILRLANVVDDRVGLTESGYAAAIAPSPALGECPDEGAISEEEAAAFRHAVKSSKAEATSVARFLELVDVSGGVQLRLDKHLARAYPTWSRMQVLSHRAAMVGRLVDLRVIRVDGRGPKSQIITLESAGEFTDVKFRERAL